jgi:hypothetical protein
MGMHSGLPRLWLWDFNAGKVIAEGLVSHGCCDNPWGEDDSKESPIFSNVPDSHCSSLGKYLLGKRGVSSWGVKINYLMHGLEKTNSKATARDIVFHSWGNVSDKAVYPAGTPEGWGCPAVSDNFFMKIDPYVRNSPKPVLFWMFFCGG